MDISCFIRKIKLSEDNYSSIVFSEKSKVYSFINPYGYHLLRKNVDLYRCQLPHKPDRFRLDKK